ncbi:hypothetical protein [Streptomyces fructofermentans]|uniref:hypothetical protein n=1 Tax=Streptomyces fructofermentans TaxID=152141 RepID=UPI00379A8C1C
MTVEQLPGQVREFARYLNELLSRIDQGGGWCGVFWQRDPEGMQACLEGWEVPPWDVVEALLHDLAAEHGEEAAAQESGRARGLHGASLTAYDARPGGRDALGDRLDVMLREQRYAAERLLGLGESLRSAGSREEAEAIRVDLAWARDDHDRATARCAELLERMDGLDRRSGAGHARDALPIPPGEDDGVFWPEEQWGEADSGAGEDGAESAAGPVEAPGGDRRDDLRRRTRAEPADGGYPGPERVREGGPGPDPGTAGGHGEPRGAPGGATEAPAADPAEGATPTAPEPAAAPERPATVPRQRGRRRPRGGARFAGMTDDGHTAAPAVPIPTTAEPAPRGARFAGVADEPERPGPRREPLDDEARRATVETVRKLVRLRAEGRTGEAHAELVEAAYWPAARFPLLAAELHRAGLGADWATLLWEAVSLPPARLVAAADALVAAGRTADGSQMLRQGVARPAEEIGRAVLGLLEEGRHREIRALLDAYVRTRTPEEAARSVEAEPGLLAPLLLEAAHHVSEERHWDLVHALRVAGYTA